ncbi:hypothetical protein LCGC14_0356300 [marine sediment metagenome]|uniref:Uncharacterized protein n=1 Tax=marine sediment metagenome TaxID=412755 RepID=A0A0F9WHN1_9ZZZZ
MARTLLSGGGLRRPGVTRSLPALAPAEPGTPSGIVQGRLALSKKQLQDKVNYNRGQIIKHGKAQGLDNTRINESIKRLYANADQKVMKLTQATETQTAGIAEMDQFGRIGGVTPDAVSRAKFRMVGGPEADRMIREPKAPTQVDPIREYGTLDVLRGRIESDEKQFRVHPAGRIPSWWRSSKQGSWWFDEKQAMEELEIKDPTMVSYDDKGRPVQGAWRKARPEEVKQYRDIIRTKEQIKQQQDVILKGPDFTNRLRSTAVRSGRMAGGPLGDQVADYMEQKQAGPQESDDFSKMSEEELRQIAGGR